MLIVSRLRIVAIATMATLAAAAPASAQTTLGAFTFDNTRFGDSVTASDGGVQLASRWLNVRNFNPGLLSALTGAHFDTGTGNIWNVAYTINYGTPILNGSGADLGIVVARYDPADFTLEVSTDGVNFVGRNVGAGTAVATGVDKKFYFYNSMGPSPADLYVHPIDLESFGLSTGATVRAVRISSSQQVDLIRAAGLMREADRGEVEEGPLPASAPEPASVLLLLPALPLALFGRRRGRG